MEIEWKNGRVLDLIILIYYILAMIRSFSKILLFALLIITIRSRKQLLAFFINISPEILWWDLFYSSSSREREQLVSCATLIVLIQFIIFNMNFL